jgi:hypothetical protein
MTGCIRPPVCQLVVQPQSCLTLAVADEQRRQVESRIGRLVVVIAARESEVLHNFARDALGQKWILNLLERYERVEEEVPPQKFAGHPALKLASARSRSE